MQAVPVELTKMAGRFNAWKEKKAAEKNRERTDLHGCRRGRWGGRGDSWGSGGKW